MNNQQAKLLNCQLLEYRTEIMQIERDRAGLVSQSL